jgi:serine/threonine-protein kinase
LPEATTPVLVSPELGATKEFAPGDVVGAYRLVEPLGEGGMALVYKVQHVTLGTTAAIKFPRAGLEKSFLDRFVNEARAHMRLVGRSHIVAPMQLDSLPDGRPLLVMQLVDGQTLSTWWPAYLDTGPTPEQALTTALRIVMQMGLGLDAAHQQTPPIVHRDLKPANTFVDAKQTATISAKQVPLVRIGDFGLAWSEGEDTTPMGTPEYVSPEQSMGQEPTPQSDLYALGIVLYELIEGRLPFESDDVVELLRLQREKRPPPLRNPEAVIWPELTQLVRGLLEKQPGQRPRNAMEVVHRLDGVLTRIEKRNEKTNVGVTVAELQSRARDTDVLPPPPTKVLPPGTSTELPKSPASKAWWALVLVPFLAFGVFKAVGGPETRTTPVAPTEPLVKTRPPEPVVLPPALIVDAGATKPTPPVPVVVPPTLVVDGGAVEQDAGSEPLAAISPVKLPPCRADDNWKKGMDKNLTELQANAREGADQGALRELVIQLGNDVKKAKNSTDCGKVELDFKKAKKRFLDGSAP